MKKRIFALSIQVKDRRENASLPEFNESLVQPILSGLSAIYDEVVIWAAKNRLGIWVVGNSDNFLTRAFGHHIHLYNTPELLADTQALEFFKNISSGSSWTEINTIRKLNTLCQAHDRSKEQGALGSVLYKMVAEGILLLSNNSIIISARNSYSHSWQRKTAETVSQNYFIDIKMPDLFYRFCLN